MFVLAEMQSVGGHESDNLQNHNPSLQAPRPTQQRPMIGGDNGCNGEQEQAIENDPVWYRIEPNTAGYLSHCTEGYSSRHINTSLHELKIGALALDRTSPPYQNNLKITRENKCYFNGCS